MKLYNVYLNRKLPFVLAKSEEKENIIYFKEFKEYLFNLGVFTTKEKDIILEYSIENNEKIIVTDILLEDGTLFENVKFKVVHIKEKNLPYSTFNFKSSSKIIKINNNKNIEPENDLNKNSVEKNSTKIDIKVDDILEKINEDLNLTNKALKIEKNKNPNFKNVLINNKISFTFFENNDTDNIFYCNKFSDNLFNVGVFKTREKEIVLEYKNIENEKIIVCDITLDNNEYYKNVEFKVVIANSKKVPFSTININKLGNKKEIIIPENKIIEEEPAINENTSSKTIIFEDDLIKEIVLKKKKYEKAIENALLEEKRASDLRKKLEKQKIIMEKSNVITGVLSKYKQELLEEYLAATSKQSEFLNNKLNLSFENAIVSLNLKLENLLKEYSNKINLQNEYIKEENIEFISNKLNESLYFLKNELAKVVKEENILVIEKDSPAELKEKILTIESKLRDKLIIEIESYKNKILDKINNVSEFKVDELLKSRKINIEINLLKTIEEQKKNLKKDLIECGLSVKKDFKDFFENINIKLPKISNEIKILEENIKKITSENLKTSKNIFTKDQQDYINNISRQWALKILDLGGGGGSVAQQFSKGGNIFGNLNIIGNNNIDQGNLNVTNGNILSAGVNLIDIFSSGVSTGVNQIIAGANITITPPGGTGAVTINSTAPSSPKIDSTYTTVNVNSANWNYAYSQIDVTTSIINYLSGQIDLNVYQNVNSLYETIQEFTSNSHSNVYNGYTVTLANKRVYVLAGSDQNNPSHYIELNANPIKPIYVEQSLSATGVIIDLFDLSDFRSAKYTLQVQTNYDNEIYFSEINVVGAVGTMQTVAVEYGQNYTTQLINEYTTFMQGSKMYLSASFINYTFLPNRKYIIRGLRTNFYKI